MPQIKPLTVATVSMIALQPRLYGCQRLPVGRHFKNILSVRGGDKGGSNFFIQFLGVSTQFELIFFKKIFVEIFLSPRTFAYRRTLMGVLLRKIYKYSD